MRILALETTELIGSVAAMCDGNLLAELKLNPQQRSAQSLAPGLRLLLEQVGWRADDVDLVAVTTGPGSFTGLRVGVTTAKAFAYAAKAEVLGVDTLETIAVRAPRHVGVLSAAVDAHRGEVVAQSFQRDLPAARHGIYPAEWLGWLRPTGDAELMEVDAWLGGLAAGTAVAGPVLRKLADRVPGHLTLLDPQYWSPTAAAVARLAARLHAAGGRDDLWSLAPRYFRRSAAEEKWDQREV